MPMIDLIITTQNRLHLKFDAIRIDIEKRQAIKELSKA